MSGPARTHHRGEGFIRPVDYSGRVRYRRPPDAYLRMQWLGPLITILGLSPKYVIILEVPGRQSGLIRRTTLVQADYNGRHYLVALAGESDWVRNVRAAGGRAVVGRRRRRAVRLAELPPMERAPVIRAYLLRSGRRPGSQLVATEARHYFGVGADATLEEIEEVAEHYPVFQIMERAPG
jgi:F420H(2)-dependent quinone reductase